METAFLACRDLPQLLAQMEPMTQQEFQELLQQQQAAAEEDSASEGSSTKPPVKPKLLQLAQESVKSNEKVSWMSQSNRT